MNDDTQQDVLSLGEFKAHLTTWLSESADERLASDGEYKLAYLRVWIGGVECQLSGDSTRAGVTDFLVAAETDDPGYFVVPNKNGVVNRVVVGVDGEPISLLVDEVGEVIDVEETQLEAPPDTLASGHGLEVNPQTQRPRDRRFDGSTGGPEWLTVPDPRRVREQPGG